MKPLSELGATAGEAKKQSPKRKRMKKKTLFIGGGVAVALVALGVFGFVALGQDSSQGSETQAQEAIVSNGSVSTTVEGTGTLASENSAEVYIPSGIEIEEIRVSAGDQVSKGDVLATVESISLNAELYSAKESLEDLEDEIDSSDTDTAAYYQLLKDQKDTQERYDILKQIAVKNTITAASDGTITAVNISEGTTSSSSSDSDSSTDSSDSSTKASSTSDTSTNTTTSSYSFVSDDSVAPTAEDESSGESSGDSADDTTGDTIVPINATLAVTTISSVNLNSVGLAPILDAKPLEKLTGTSYTGTVSWNKQDTTFKAGAAYEAEIVLTANSGYEFSTSPRITLSGAEEISYELEDASTLKITAVYSALEKAATTQSTTNNQSSGSTDGNSTNSSSGSTSGNTSSGTNGSTSGTGSSSGTGSISGTGSSSSGTSSDSSSTSSTDSTSDTSSSSSDNSSLISAFTLASGDNMTLTVSIDELDILSVSQGQAARVTLDALEGEAFEGEITSVSTSGTSSDGVTKYTAEVTLGKTESMLAGMNASVSIVIQESADTLYIPSAALQDDGNRTYVYTAKDAETGALSGEVDVEIGNADGSITEITSGLSEGDVVYYEVAGTTEDTMSTMMGGMEGGVSGGGEMPDSGNMPSGGGGDMPSGGGGSGRSASGGTQ